MGGSKYPQLKELLLLESSDSSSATSTALTSCYYCWFSDPFSVVTKDPPSVVVLKWFNDESFIYLLFSLSSNFYLYLTRPNNNVAPWDSIKI